MSSSKGRLRANVRQYSAEDQALNQISAEAENRLAAKRAARAEAREIRMKEIEKQQKEAEEREANQSNASSSSKVRDYDSRRGSGDSTESDSTKDSKDRNYKQELRDLQEKFKNAMMTSAQLDNEKQSLVYQVELLKDQFEEHEEGYLELQREYKSKCSEFELQKRSLRELSGEHSLMKSQVEYLDKLLKENGLVIITAESGEMSLQKDQSAIPSGSISTGAALLSAETIEILKKAGEGSLGTKSHSNSGQVPVSNSISSDENSKVIFNDTGQKSESQSSKDAVELHTDSVISELNSEEDKKVLANLEKDTECDEIDGRIFLKPSESLAKISEHAKTDVSSLPRDSRESTVESDTKGSQSEGDSALDQYSEDVNDALENVTLDDQIPPIPDQKSKTKPDSLKVPETLRQKSSTSDCEEFFDAPSTPLPSTPLPVVNGDQKINLDSTTENLKNVDDSSKKRTDKKPGSSETLDADLIGSLVTPTPASKSERKKKKSRSEVENLAIPENLNSSPNDTPSPKSEVEKLKFPPQITSSGLESSELDSPRPNPSKEEPQSSKSKKNKKKNKKRKNDFETQKPAADKDTKSSDIQNNNTNTALSNSADTLKDSQSKAEKSESKTEKLGSKTEKSESKTEKSDSKISNSGDQNSKSDSKKANNQNPAPVQESSKDPPVNSEKDPLVEEGKGGKKKRKRGKNKGKNKGKQESVDSVGEDSSVVGGSAVVGASSVVVGACAVEASSAVGSSELEAKEVESKEEEAIVGDDSEEKSKPNDEGSSVDFVDMGTKTESGKSNDIDSKTGFDQDKDNTDTKMEPEEKSETASLEADAKLSPDLEGSSVDFVESKSDPLTPESPTVKESLDQTDESPEKGMKKPDAKEEIKTEPTQNVGDKAAEDTSEELGEEKEEEIFVEAVEELPGAILEVQQGDKEDNKSTNPKKSMDMNKEESLWEKTKDNVDDLSKEQADLEDADNDTEDLAKKDVQDSESNLVDGKPEPNQDDETESTETAPVDGNPEDEKKSDEPVDGNPEAEKESKESDPNTESKDQAEEKTESETVQQSNDDVPKASISTDATVETKKENTEKPSDKESKTEEHKTVLDKSFEASAPDTSVGQDTSLETKNPTDISGELDVSLEVSKASDTTKPDSENLDPSLDVIKSSDTTKPDTSAERDTAKEVNQPAEVSEELNAPTEVSKPADTTKPVEVQSPTKSASSPQSSAGVDLIDQAAEMLAQLQRLKSGKKGKSKKKKKTEEPAADGDKKESVLDQQQAMSPVGLDVKKEAIVDNEQGAKSSTSPGGKKEEDTNVMDKKEDQETTEKPKEESSEMPKKIEMTTDLDASFEEASADPSKDIASDAKLETPQIEGKKVEMTTDLDASFEEASSEPSKDPNASAASLEEAQKTPSVTVMTTDLDASLEDLSVDLHAVDLNESVENTEYSFDDIDDILGDDDVKAPPTSSPTATETTSLASSRSSFSSLKAPESSEAPKSPKVDKKSKKKKKSDRDSAEIPASPTTSPKEDHNKNGGEKQKKKGGFLKGFFR